MLSLDRWQTLLMTAAPKGGINAAPITASLKRCPDTKLGLSAVSGERHAALLLLHVSSC
jgi:hypothetical protein